MATDDTILVKETLEAALKMIQLLDFGVEYGKIKVDAQFHEGRAILAGMVIVLQCDGVPTFLSGAEATTAIKKIMVSIWTKYKLDTIMEMSVQRGDALHTQR